MARYPTFDDYVVKRNFKDGIQRCDELLKKHPKEVQLLTTKLQLLAADKQDIKGTLDQLLAIDPPIRDIGELFTINGAVVQAQQNVWPRARTVGPEVSKLWENAVKASTSANTKLELLIQRYQSSVEANYMVDAQQALIQLKALQPKNRVIYMAHAAVTQLISTSKDDMQSRLALMLSKKAVKEKFNEEKDLDCRVPGQIFTLQGSMTDLESIQGTKIAESKQAYGALQISSRSETNGSAAVPESNDPSTVPSAEWLAAEVAILKAHFAQLIESAASLNVMLSFAASAIRLFHTSIKSVPGARARTKGDACFVAISALVRAYELSHQFNHLLVSAHLAGILLEIDEHIHEARMILIYLYLRLGLGSLAIRYFDSLNIKEVQLDTVGHALFTGLSHVYPHRLTSGNKEDSNPMSRAKKAIQVYIRCEERLYESEMNILSNGQTGMIFDLHELRDVLRSSITKRIIFLEVRRQARLLVSDSNWHTEDLGPNCVANWHETSDNRDFAATFDYGYNVEKALHGYNGKLPGREWILYGLATDVAWCLASSKDADSPIENPQDLLDELENDLPDMSELGIDDKPAQQLSMSNSEYLAGNLAYLVLKLVMLIKSKPAADDVERAVGRVVKAVDRLNVGALCETTDVFTERLRDHFVYFDVLKVVSKVCEFGCKGDSSLVSDALQKLQERVKGDLAALRAHGEEQRRRVTARGIKAEMARSGEDVFAALRGFGEDGLGGFCDAVEVSSKDGWSGLGKLKM